VEHPAGRDLERRVELARVRLRQPLGGLARDEGDQVADLLAFHVHHSEAAAPGYLERQSRPGLHQHFARTTPHHPTPRMRSRVSTKASTAVMYASSSTRSLAASTKRESPGLKWIIGMRASFQIQAASVPPSFPPTSGSRPVTSRIDSRSAGNTRMSGGTSTLGQSSTGRMLAENSGLAARSPAINPSISASASPEDSPGMSRRSSTMRQSLATMFGTVPPAMVPTVIDGRPTRGWRRP